MNHETKLVMLWIDNSESVHNFWNRQAKRTYLNAEETNTFSKYESAKYDLATYMKEKFTTEMYDMCEISSVNGLWADLLSSALQNVNWSEVADCYLEDCKSAA
jgi:hypothetical protein